MSAKLKKLNSMKSLELCGEKNRASGTSSGVTFVFPSTLLPAARNQSVAVSFISAGIASRNKF